MTKEFFEEVMSIPSVSQHEDMMIDFLMKWGPEHGCKTKKDAKGNVYMEKGSGIRPTLLDHVDTVHHDQEEMIKQKVKKEIVWAGDHVTAKNPLTGKQTGLGMDNQGGACIALAVIDRLKAVKAIFTVEEEIGMNGIRAADMSFFDDAAFVFSNDSPDENRATHYSSGVQLYSDDFFKKYLEPICKKHGVTSFRSEPWTCIKVVRSTWKDKDGKHLECLNFGNAGDKPHSDQEGASFKGVCNAEELLYALCTEIPTDVQHVSDISEEPRSYWSGSSSSSYSSYSPWTSSWRPGSSWRSGATDDMNRKGSFVWAFNSEKIRDRYVERMKPRFASSLKVENVGRQSVRVSGEWLYLRSAYMFAFNYDNGTSYASWMDFERYDRTAASRFEDDFKADPVDASSEKDPAKGHGNFDEGVVYVAVDSDEDMDVAESAILDAEVPVDVDRQAEGLAISGPLVSMQRAFAIACDVLNGTSRRFFKALDKREQDEFWKSVAFDGEYDPTEVIDADYTVVGEPEKKGGEETSGEDLFAWADRRNAERKAKKDGAEKAKEYEPLPKDPISRDLLRGHSPDEKCSVELKIGMRPGFRDDLVRAFAAENLTAAEFPDRFVISGRLEDVIRGCVAYMNAFFDREKYRSFQDLAPQQRENFWQEVKFGKN